MIPRIENPGTGLFGSAPGTPLGGCPATNRPWDRLAGHRDRLRTQPRRLVNGMGFSLPEADVAFLGAWASVGGVSSPRSDTRPDARSGIRAIGSRQMEAVGALDLLGLLFVHAGFGGK